MWCTLIYICQMHANLWSVEDYMNSINVSFTGSHKILQMRYRLSLKCLKMYFQLRYVFFSPFLWNKIYGTSRHTYMHIIYSQCLKLVIEMHYFPFEVFLKILFEKIFSNYVIHFKVNWILMYHEMHAKSYTELHKNFY